MTDEKFQSNQIGGANRTYHKAQSHMELLPNYYAWTYGIFRRYLKGEVIELGCGAGLGIKTYVDRVQRIFAVDYNEELLRRVRQSLAGAPIETIQADLCGEWTELKGVSGDVIVLMDVLEHFEDDFCFLEKAAALLKPGGHIVVKVPAQAHLYSPMDEASGHYRRYDPSDIRRLAEATGLHVDHLHHTNRVGALAYRLKNRSRSNFSKTFSPTQLRLINIALPLARALDVVPGLPGMSLAVVLSKAG